MKQGSNSKAPQTVKEALEVNLWCLHDCGVCMRVCGATCGGRACMHASMTISEPIYFLQINF